MLTEEEYGRFKECITNLEKQVSESEGAAKQIRTDLQKEFGCKNADAAEKLLKKLRRELKDAESKFVKDLKAFTKMAKKRVKRTEGVEIDIQGTLDLLQRIAKATKRRKRKS